MLGAKHISYDDFQYVVERKKPAPISFGSGVVRDTNPVGQGLSSFQKRYAFEIFTKITPQTYNVQTSGVAMLANKVQSKRGVGGLSNRAPRFPHTRTQIPAVMYHPEPKWRKRKRRKLPFGQALGRTPIEGPDTPGIGSYNLLEKRCPRARVAYNFGKPKLVQVAEVHCKPVPSDVCDRCHKVCENDYWHKNYTTFLCHSCMEERKAVRRYSVTKKLKEYKKLRTCQYMHNHEGMVHAEQLLSKSMLNKIDQLENYLDLFFRSV